MRDVTADVISQGDAAQEQQRRDAAERIDKAIESLISETQSQELSKTKAEAFLMSKGMTRQTARELIERHAGRHWKLEKKGKAFVLVPVKSNSAARKTDAPNPLQAYVSDNEHLAVCSGTARRETALLELKPDATSNIGGFSPPEEERL